MMILWSHKQIETFSRTHRSVQLKLICHRNIPFVMSWRRKNVGKAFSLFQLYFQRHLFEHTLFASSHAPPPAWFGSALGKWKANLFRLSRFVWVTHTKEHTKLEHFPNSHRSVAGRKRWFAPKASHSGWLWIGLCPKRFWNCAQRTTICPGQCNLTWFYDLFITSDTVCDKSLVLIDWERSNWKSLTKLPPIARAHTLTRHLFYFALCPLSAPYPSRPAKNRNTCKQVYFGGANPSRRHTHNLPRLPK